MISDRQKSYRQVYRSRIMGFYDGYLHIAIIYAMGAAAFYIYLQHIHAVTPLEWLAIPITFLFTNVFEWAVHRFIMHRPVNIKGLRAIYERHTLNHHQFFTDSEMRFADHHEVAVLHERRRLLERGRRVQGCRVRGHLRPERRAERDAPEQSREAQTAGVATGVATGVASRTSAAHVSSSASTVPGERTREPSRDP